MELIQPGTSAHSSIPPSPGAIREQLERLLASPRFSTSPRCQLLLRYVVEETLKGHAEALKERNIGTEVFRRDPAYDTNADPTVRVAASEIRKKLAQYYYEPGHQDQVRIELPTGSYAPVFSVQELAAPASDSAPPAADNPAQDSATDLTDASRTIPATQGLGQKSRLRLWLLGAVVALFVAGSFTTWYWRATHAPINLFWAPLMDSRAPILLCTGEIGSQHGMFPNPSSTTSSQVMALGPNGVYSRELVTVVFDDVVLLTNLAAKLHAEKKPYTMRYESNTTYEDLLKGPVILIGSFNNAWTMHFTSPMRYSFAHDSDNFLWIADKQNPGVKLGMQRVNQEIYGTEEYAVVARLLDSEAKQPALIVAGVTPAATRAAGEFVTNPQLMADTLQHLPPGWKKRNLELLLKIHVIDNQAGPPQLVSQVIW